MIKRMWLLGLALLSMACTGPQTGPAPEPAAAGPAAPPGSSTIAAPDEFQTTQSNLYSVHLYRHAEKQPGPDPELTSYGRARALHLAERLSQPAVAIRRIWSSPYRRTQQTAQPLAARLGIEVSTYDPRNQQVLVLALHESAMDAVVVGHSNTIPELAAKLCQCEVEAMPESQYERGYVVVLGRGVNELYEVDMSRTWVSRPAQAD